MRSDLPKVLQPLGGRPMLTEVLDTSRSLAPESIVCVVGHGAKQVRSAFPEPDIVWVEQTEQLGTGHAVQQALPALKQDDTVLVLYGDVPLVSTSILGELTKQAATELVLLTVELADPSGYGRIVRNASGSIQKIVEQKDASDDELQIREVNSGLLACPASHLSGWLDRLSNDNAQGEYYLTDIVGFAVADGMNVGAVVANDPAIVSGVNDRVQLAQAERVFQQRKAAELMKAGAQLLDPARTDIRGSVEVGRDVSIDVNVIFEGEVRLGNRVEIGANCFLKNCVIGDDAVIRPFSHLEGASVGQRAVVGPYARLREGTDLADETKVGNFVETKKAVVGFGSKINHLSYVGDAELGRNVNVGAGTITCNYDGVNKHKTVIGDDAFIGSNSALVAPVEIGAGATVGAGSTINNAAPAGQLTVSRARQRSLAGWSRPAKKDKS